MVTWSLRSITAHACSLLLLAGCGAKHEAENASPTPERAPTAVAAAPFDLAGGWQCKHHKKSPPGFFYRSYHFGPDNIFGTEGKDGDNTLLVAGAYQLNGDAPRQTLRWIEGTMAAFAPTGEILAGWRVSQPGGEIMRSNFRDRQTEVRIVDMNNILLKPVSISSGPGGEVATPNPPDEFPCVRKPDEVAEAAWRSVPRPFIAQVLSAYPINPTPAVNLNAHVGVKIDPSDATNTAMPAQGPQQASPQPSMQYDELAAAETAVLNADARLDAAIQALQANRACQGELEYLISYKGQIRQNLEYAEQFRTNRPTRLAYLQRAADMGEKAANRFRGTRCLP